VSDVGKHNVSCPQCGYQGEVDLFSSLNGQQLRVQVEEILDGTFEEQECPGCGTLFRPEHPMLYSELSTRTWIVMHPPVDRARFAVIERGVAQVLAKNFATAPPSVADSLAGVRPRLVFGQLMLTEALRVLRAGLPPALLECAKLFALRRNLAQLMPFGPSQLVFEELDEQARLCCGIYARPDDRRRGELRLPADALAEMRASQPRLRELYPELFSQPYVSASRYLVD
jgi:CpXC protein